MRRRGYDLRLSAGTILGGAALDPIIPPSILAVIVATLAQISTGKLLIAGILPGLLIAGMYVVYVLVRVRINPGLAPDVEAEVLERRSSGGPFLALVRMLPCAFIFFLVMGLVMLGVATPTEAAATGVFGALALALYYGGLSRRMVWDAMAAAARVSTLLLVIMSCAVMFSQLLTLTGAARALGEAVANLRLTGTMMLFLMMALPFVLFMFLDQVAIMLVLIPIYQPLLKLYGFDEIWFWTLFLIVTVTGSLTPPFGYTLFALKSAAPDVPLSEIFRASWPFVWIIVAAMAVMAVFPGIITFLPELMK
jgi:tripartite ATP-independent transporter DctM subunit